MRRCRRCGAQNSLVWLTARCNCLRVPRDYFGEDVAARYDASSGAMFDPEVLGATVDVCSPNSLGAALHSSSP